MIRLTLIALVCTMTAFGATRSEEEVDEKGNPTVHFGPFIGVNLANAKVSRGGASDNRLGLSAGIFLETPILSSFITAQPEIKYIQHGASNSALGPRASVRLDYVEVPFLFKLRIPGLPVKPSAFAGPKLAFLLSASGDNTLSSIDRSRFRSFDFGADLGVGVDFDIAQSTTAFFTARYGFGLVNVDPSGDWKNESFQMLFGVYL